MKILFSLLFFTFLTITSYGQRKNPFKTLVEHEGKIGIGTKTPDALLTVNGTIHTREVRVDLDGATAPDYVFQKYFLGASSLQPSYEMMSLNAVEAFIKEYHHLPGVPSASQLKEEGVDLKELNLLLLEKIEELTLHLIEQRKEIDQLKKEISPLDN